MSWRPSVEQRARHVRDLRSGDVTASAIGTTLCEPVTRAERDAAVSRIMASRRLLARYSLEPDWKARHGFVLDVAASSRVETQRRPKIAPGVALDLTEARARRRKKPKAKLPADETTGPPDTLPSAAGKPTRSRLDLSAVLAERRAARGETEPRPPKPEGAYTVRGHDGSARWYSYDPAFWQRHHVLDDLAHHGPFGSITLSKGTLPGPNAGMCSARGDDDGAWLTITIDAERSGPDIGKIINHEIAHAAHLCALQDGWPDLHGDREAVAAAEAWAEAMESQMGGSGYGLILEARKVFDLGGDPDDWRWG